MAQWIELVITRFSNEIISISLTLIFILHYFEILVTAIFIAIFNDISSGY
jgi:hypothetical protein